MNAEFKTKNGFAAHFQVDCECGCGDGFRLVIEKDTEIKDNEAWMLSTTCKFDALQRWSAFLNRIQTAWKVLFNKEFWFHSIILTKEDLLAMRDFIDKNVNDTKIKNNIKKK